MTPQPGKTLSHYRLEQKIGAGGMGEVWKATDTTLDRSVAIKFLPEAFAEDADRLARFEREAKLLASLHHPGIAVIHGFHHEEGAYFLVMELVEGEDLSQRLERGALPLQEAVAIGVQVAEALEAAHENGVIHRDLKPANIQLTPEGKIKVLDFGLAKAYDAVSPLSSASLSPTLTAAAATQAGVIMGTAAYMDPEQAKGKSVDKRADIWAFGCVLYELLAGRPPFGGDSITEVLSAVTRDEPDWKALPPATPAHVLRLLRRCLVKDPQQRLRDIGDARISLAGPADAPELRAQSAIGSGPGKASRPRWLLIVGVGLALVLSAATGGWLARRQAPSTVSLAPAIVRVTSDPGLSTTPAVTPAGNLIAYASDRSGEGGLDIWVQPLPTGEPVRVTTSAADDVDPHFSPDGSRIVFRSERDSGGIYMVPALGGTERMIAPRGRRPRFSPDGRWITYYAGGRGSNAELYVMETAGSPPRRLAEDFQNAGHPVWSPDSRYILFQGNRLAEDGTPGQIDWWTVSPDGGVATPSGAFETLGRTSFLSSKISAWIAAPERLIFTVQAGDARSVWELPIFSASRRVRGPSQRLTAGSGLDGSPTVVADGGGERLIFSSETSKAGIWRLPIEADQARLAGPLLRLTDSAASDWWPSVSADGRKLAFLSTRFGNPDVWVKDLETGAETSLTMTVGRERTARISPNGGRVAFMGEDGRPYSVTTGGGVPSVLAEGSRYVWDWPDEALALMGSGGKIERVDLASQTVTTLIGEEGRSFYLASASPDLQWFSFIEWTSPDRTRVLIAPLRDGPIPESEWVVVTEGQYVDEESDWSPDGRVLYFISERDGWRCLWAQRLDPESKRPDGAPFALQHFHQKRHAMIQTVEGPQRIAVATDAVYFSIQELAGNIWMATLDR